MVLSSSSLAHFIKQLVGSKTKPRTNQTRDEQPNGAPQSAKKRRCRFGFIKEYNSVGILVNPKERNSRFCTKASSPCLPGKPNRRRIDERLQLRLTESRSYQSAYLFSREPISQQQLSTTIAVNRLPTEISLA